MKVNKLLIGALLIIIVAVLLLSTKLTDKTQPEQATTVTTYNNTDAAFATAVTIGSSAPDFTLTTLEKDTFRLSNKKGKIVILFGVAGWCGECIPEGKARDYKYTK